MNSLNHKTRAEIFLVVWAMLSSCSLFIFSGYAYTITAFPEQQSIRFECRTSTATGKCHITIGTETRGTNTVPVGTIVMFNHAAIGTRYCVSEAPILWEACSKASVVSGTTRVESGQSVSGFHLFRRN